MLDILGSPGQRWLTATGGWECNIATLMLAGTIEIVRLLEDNVAVCEALAEP